MWVGGVDFWAGGDEGGGGILIFFNNTFIIKLYAGLIK